jgi:hypothetical protein
MGSITRFDLLDLHEKFGVRHFVETGTGAGHGVAFAADAELPTGKLFHSLWSCEIEPALADAARAQFRDDPRVNIVTARSETFLERVCGELPPGEPILFWLDAHFPGADHGIRAYGDEGDPRVRLPLRQELEIIARHRKGGRDVVLCDDLRIYKEGPFMHGNLPEDMRALCPTDRNIDFVHEVMDATHDFQEFYEHEGYLLLAPKKTDTVSGAADPKAVATVLMAAMLFGLSGDGTEGSIHRAFDRAEKFIEVAEQRTHIRWPAWMR